MRSAQRLTTTLPNTVFDELVQRSLSEGRSLSNLAAYLQKWALRTDTGSTGVSGRPRQEM